MKAASFVRFAALLGLKLTRGQRAHDRVAYDGTAPCDLPADEREVARTIFGDIDRVPPGVRRVSVQKKGRDGGGTRRAAYRCLQLGLTLGLEIDPSELAYVFFGAPKLRLGRVALRFSLEGARKLAARGDIAIESETADSFVVVRHDGRCVKFECFAASRGGDAIRGVPIIALLLDEAAFYFDELTGVVNDRAIFNAGIPRLQPGGQIIIVSSPWKATGLLAEEFISNFGKPTTALAANCPTLVMRDDVRTRAMVAMERLRDEGNAAVEFDAEFASSGAGQFLEIPTIRAAVVPGMQMVTAAPIGVRCFGGADLALLRDASAIAIVHRSGSEQAPIYTVAECAELRPMRGSPLDLGRVMAEFATVAGRHGVNQVMADHHLLTVANALAPEGLQLTACPGGAGGKQEVYTRVRDLFRAGLVRMPESMVDVRDQLSEITSTPAAGGGLQIRSPRRNGTHGDLAAAVVLALYSASSGQTWHSLTPQEWDDWDRAAMSMSWGSAGGFGAGGVI